MPSSFARTDRQAEEMKRALSAIITSELKDPRIPEMLSVTYVDLARDLSFAKVGVSAILDEEGKKQMLKALKGASGFLRHELGARILMRQIPQLQFVIDASIERGAHINSMLNSLSQQFAKQEESDETDN